MKRKKMIEIKRKHTQANEDYVAEAAKHLGNIPLAQAQRMILTRAKQLKIMLK